MILFGKIEVGLGRGLRRALLNQNLLHNLSHVLEPLAMQQPSLKRDGAFRAVPKNMKGCGAKFDLLIEREVGNGPVEATQGEDEGARDLSVKALSAI